MAQSMTLFYVAIGGALGAVLRYLCSVALVFPYATLFVNVTGSFLMGLAFVVLSGADNGPDVYQPLVMTGFLGGFTTFSAYSLDTLRLVEQGDVALAAAYVVGTVCVCLVAVFAGVALGRGIWA